MRRRLQCRTCGTDLLVGAKFCISCGGAAISHCAACGTTSPVAAVHCPDCGADMTMASSAGAERRQVTVMFCDLVGSTPLSLRFDPEQLRDTVAAYQQACAQVIGAYDGYIYQYLGDGILAYFGFPTAREDAAERAVRAGLEVIAAVARLRDPDGAALSGRVGIATGLVVVGFGAPGGSAAVGETPNLAARLQALAHPGSVLIAGSTRRLIRDKFELRDLGLRALKGFGDAVQTWAVEGHSTSGNRFRPPRAHALIGRTREAQTLLDRLDTAWSGRSQVILITGEAGVGKSHLAGWLATHTAARRHFRMQFQCSPYHRASALHPFIAQLSHAAGIARTAEPAHRLDKLEALLGQAGVDVSAVAPLFASLLSIPSAERYAPLNMNSEQQRQLTLSALLDQLDGLARMRPLLLLFEDLQWADPTTIELIGESIGRLATAPILAILTARPEFAVQWRDADNVTALDLGRLEPQAARTMVANMAPAGLLSDDIIDRIVDRSDGVPLYIEELTKTMLDQQSKPPQGDSFAGLGRSPLVIPESLRDSLTERLDRLAADREVAQIGAAIGRDFPYDLLRRVSGRDDAVLEDALAELVSSELVAARASPGERMYRFKHALVQEAAYETLLKSRRRIIHRRIAETLLRDFRTRADEEPEVLAHHFTFAGIPDQAIEWWKTAGEWAVNRSAYAEAASHFTQAIALTEAIPPGKNHRLLQLRLQVAFGQVMIASRGYAAPEATAAFKAARQLAAGIEDAAERYSVYHGLWAGSHVRSDLAPMREMSEAFLQDVQGQAGTPEAGIAQRIAGTTYAFEGRFALAKHHLQQALASYDPDRDRALAMRFGHDIGVAAECYLALVHWLLGDTEQAAMVADAAIGHAAGSGHAPTAAYGHAYRCIFEALRQNPLAAAENAQSLLALSREHRMHWWLSNGIFFSGWTRWHAGFTDEGGADMRRGMDLCREHGLAAPPALFETLVALTEDQAGQAEAALARLDHVLGRIHRTGERWLEAEVHRHRGRLLTRIGHPDRRAAESAFRHAVAVASEQGAPTFRLRAMLGLAQLRCVNGADRGVLSELNEACSAFRSGQDLPELQRARELLQQHAG